jgi:hypothetical protein
MSLLPMPWYLKTLSTVPETEMAVHFPIDILFQKLVEPSVKT